MAWEGCGSSGAVCSPWTLLSKFVNRNQTAILMCPVVCLDVFKELFEVEQFTEIEWISFCEQVNFSLGFSPQSYCFRCPSFGLWACSPKTSHPNPWWILAHHRKALIQQVKPLCLSSIANYRIRKKKSIFKNLQQYICYLKHQCVCGKGNSEYIKENQVPPGKQRCHFLINGVCSKT